MICPTCKRESDSVVLFRGGGGDCRACRAARSEHLDVATAMERDGGSFVQALGAALRRADPINQAKLRATWPEYWQQYAAIAACRIAEQDPAYDPTLP